MGSVRGPGGPLSEPVVLPRTHVPKLKNSVPSVKIYPSSPHFISPRIPAIIATGYIIRSIFLPAHALKKKYAFRRFTLTHLGRSEVLLVGTLCPEHGEFLLTVTASTLRPMQFAFPAVPADEDVRRVIDAIPIEQYLADTHGSPEHRQHLTRYFAEQIRQELSA